MVYVLLQSYIASTPRVKKPKDRTLSRGKAGVKFKNEMSSKNRKEILENKELVGNKNINPNETKDSTGRISKKKNREDNGCRRPYIVDSI